MVFLLDKLCGLQGQYLQSFVSSHASGGEQQNKENGGQRYS